MSLTGGPKDAPAASPGCDHGATQTEGPAGLEGVATGSPRRGGAEESPRRPSFVARTALFERLSSAPAGSVILVVAPPGSGKTVLLRSWAEAAGLQDRLAWVSVERGEHDAQRFWLSVIQALAAAAPELGMDQPAPTPDFDARVTADRVLTTLTALAQPVVLVVDDMHELVSREAQAQFELFIARRPPKLRIVVATRHDPQLGLHRLRLAGELVEVRAVDLRFTADEARQLFALSAIELSNASVDLLMARTEGWAAGLRLASLSLEGQRDRDAFVAKFSGSERTVADYLLAEVLDRQPEDVREFLLRTCIVDRLNASLADALAGSAGSSATLTALESEGAFVERMDGDPGTFRYHHLLVDLLRLELRRRHPDAVPELHLLASAWHEDHGMIIDAVRHAQAAKDWPTAVRLLVSNVLSLILDGQTSTLAALLEGFPLANRSTAELALVYAGIDIVQGSLDDGAAFLDIANRGSDDVPTARRHAYEVESAVARLSLARRRGDVSTVTAEIHALLDRSGATTQMEVELNNDARAVALLELGIAELWTSDVSNAERHLEQGLELARRIGRPFLEIGCLGYLAVIAGARSLPRNYELAREALAVADAHGWGADPIATMPLATLATASINQGRYDEGRAWLERTVRALREQVEPASAILVRLAEAMLLVGEGDLAAAVDRLRAAEAIEAALVMPDVVVRQVRQLQVNVLLRLGRIEEATQAAAGFSDVDRDSGEAWVAAADLELSLLRPESALRTLAPVLERQVPTIGDATLIHGWIVAARAHDALGDARAAQAAIENALDSAEPQALIFPFVLSAALEILERQPRHATRHAALLTDILDILNGSSLGQRPHSGAAPIEELTESEVRVLRFLPSNLSAPEIAAELFLSTSTVKTHMRHIYDKLGVHKRTELVQRARDLGLLANAARRIR